jgi:RNA polymerase sigma factor (sigma-70 family)
MTTQSPQSCSPRTPAFDPERPVAPAAKNPRELLTEQLPLITALVRHTARRHRLSPQDTDDLASSVFLHLVQNDYHVLRQFRGHSSLRTYLSVVVTRRCLDHRNEEWGKWRASAEARRVGPVAVRLERAIWRDRMSVAEACAALAGEGIRLTRDEAGAILEQIPSRTPRRLVGAEHLDGLPAPTEAPDTAMWSQTAQIASRMLQSALTRLGAAERQLLKQRFRDRMSVADLARQNGVDQKALYRRFDALLGRLRTDLEHQGVRALR